MTTRRDFLKLATSSGLLAGIPASHALALPTYQVAEQMLSLFAYDPQDAAACDFAAALQQSGVTSIAVGNDLTELLQRQILPRLEDARFRAAGVTEGFPAYALGEVVRDYGYAITYMLADWQQGWRNVSFGKQPSGLGHNYADQLTLASEPLFWVLAPSGVNFRS